MQQIPIPQIVCYFRVGKFLAGLLSQQSGTTAQWYSNKKPEPRYVKLNKLGLCKWNKIILYIGCHSK